MRVFSDVRCYCSLISTHEKMEARGHPVRWFALTTFKYMYVCIYIYSKHVPKFDVVYIYTPFHECTNIISLILYMYSVCTTT